LTREGKIAIITLLHTSPALNSNPNTEESMSIAIEGFLEHKTAGRQQIFGAQATDMLIAPGASSSCLGCSSCSTAAVTNLKNWTMPISEVAA
jgi:hypothetical protein